MTLDVKRLRELCEKATPEWFRAGRPDMQSYDGDGYPLKNLYNDKIEATLGHQPLAARIYGENSIADSQFMEAANPKTMLALLDELEKYQKNADVSICAYCGHEGPKTSEAMAEHVLACIKNPVAVLLDRLAVAEKVIRANDQYWKCCAEFDDPKYCSEYATAADDATGEYLESIRSDKSREESGALKSSNPLSAGLEPGTGEENP